MGLHINNTLITLGRHNLLGKFPTKHTTNKQISKANLLLKIVHTEIHYT